MKKVLCLFLALITVFGLTACSGGKVVKDLDAIKKAGVIRVGMECNYAPFNWTQSKSSEDAVALASGGYADGYDVRIAKKIADELGVKLEIVKLEWNGLTLALQSNKIDAIIAGMSPTEERKLTIDFSDPYYESELVIVVRKDGAYANASKLSDFAGAKITGQLNTYHYKAIDQIQGVKKQTALKDFPAMIVALQSGSIDGYVSERPGAVSAVSANNDLTYIQFEGSNGFKTNPEDVQIAVGIRKGSDLAESINPILAKISKAERQSIMDMAVANQPLSN
jgi:putative lysine transport system substrate-binding protein